MGFSHKSFLLWATFLGLGMEQPVLVLWIFFIINQGNSKLHGPFGCSRSVFKAPFYFLPTFPRWPPELTFTELYSILVMCKSGCLLHLGLRLALLAFGWIPAHKFPRPRPFHRLCWTFGLAVCPGPPTDSGLFCNCVYLCGWNSFVILADSFHMFYFVFD